MKRMTRTYIIVMVVVMVILTRVNAQNKSQKFRQRIIPTEQDIQTEILTNYNSEVKPLGQSNRRKLEVSFDMKITKLNSLDVKNQVLSVTAFTTMKWKDERLSWNESQHDDIERVNIGNTHIWTPDILLHYNSDEQIFPITDLYRSKVMVDSGGKVVWVTPVTWKSSCQVDVTWFPFDLQICNMTFGSWSYNSNQLQLLFNQKPSKKENLISSDGYIENGVWEILSISTYEEDRTYACCNQPFSTITYSIELQRYPEFYLLYIILPLISQIFLFLIVFHISPISGERMGFGVTILLNITMYIVLVSEKLPEKSDTRTAIGLMFVTLFYLLSIGLAVSAVTMMLSQRTTKLPDFVNKFLKYFRKKCPKATSKIYKQAVFTESDSGKRGEYELPTLDITTPGDNSKNISPSVSSDKVVNGEFKGWMDFMRFVDKCLCYIFLFLVIFLPLCIVASLDKTGLGNKDSL